MNQSVTRENSSFKNVLKNLNCCFERQVQYLSDMKMYGVYA